MAVHIDGEFADREMPTAGFLHALLERHRPRRHAIVEARAGLGARGGARAVFHALAGVAHELVLIGRDVFALEPDRRAHGAVGADGVARPVAARIVEIEPTRKGHGDDLEGELLREQQRELLHRLEVAGTAMQEKDADPSCRRRRARSCAPAAARRPARRCPSRARARRGGRCPRSRAPRPRASPARRRRWQRPARATRSRAAARLFGFLRQDRHRISSAILACTDSTLAARGRRRRRR